MSHDKYITDRDLRILWENDSLFCINDDCRTVFTPRNLNDVLLDKNHVDKFCPICGSIIFWFTICSNTIDCYWDVK